MKINHFEGPLASEFSEFSSTLEASASANKSTLAELRALDRMTKESQLPLGTIDEALAVGDVLGVGVASLRQERASGRGSFAHVARPHALCRRDPRTVAGAT